LPAIWPVPAVPNEVTISCAPDMPFAACVSLASGVVGPWSVYRLKRGETQSEFELSIFSNRPMTAENWNLHLSVLRC
jgi:hypothetical protein